MEQHEETNWLVKALWAALGFAAIGAGKKLALIAFLRGRRIVIRWWRKMQVRRAERRMLRPERLKYLRAEVKRQRAVIEDQATKIMKMEEERRESST